MAQVAKIENVRRLRHERRSIYTALEDLDFHWDLKEVLEFDHMWNEGLSLWDIARAFGRDPDEVAILAMDRIRQGAIQMRPGGAFGNRRPPSRGGELK